LTDPLYLGIDFGTSGCRACVIDPGGAIRAEAAEPLPDPVARRQDPELWWQALTSVLDRLTTRVPAPDVAAIAVDGTSGSLLLCNADGTPTGPALLYHNTEASAAAAAIARVAPAGSAVHGPASGLAKLLYLRARPEGSGARHALHQADWLSGRLCGRFGVSDENNALKLGYDPEVRRWPDWLDRLDVPRALLPEVLAPGRPIGTLTPALARRWNFGTATRLVSGTTDSTAGFLATGAGPGEAVTTLGSTLVLKICTERPVYAPAYGIYSHRLGGHWLAGGASNSGGAVLRQFFSAADLNRLSRQLQPDRPTGLDYYPLPAVGERFPVNDPALVPRLEPRPADDAVFFQGLLEGITAIEVRGYRLLESLGAPWPRRVLTAGGGAVNAGWRALRESALGIPVERALHTQAAYGAALLARQGDRNGTEP